MQRGARELIGNREVLRGLDAKAFTDQRFGEPTVRDILAELEKPGRDPRGDFVTASFHEGVEKIADLKPGMKLQGVVTNVANFGAFVDVGVHHDGLVHVSELADRFVKDPREVAKAGQLVSVTVLEVDVARKRIALSMKSGAQADRGGAAARTGAAPSGRGAAKPRHEQHDKAREAPPRAPPRRRPRWAMRWRGRCGAESGYRRPTGRSTAARSSSCTSVASARFTGPRCERLAAPRPRSR